MTEYDIRDQLEQIASDRNFAMRSAELTDMWSSYGVGVEAIEPILHFIEEHPSIDFGAPGALVHFVERFCRRGYEERLITSIKRKPNTTTVSMLNAVINGTQEHNAKLQLIEVMQAVGLNPLADENTLKRVRCYLDRYSK